MHIGALGFDVKDKKKADKATRLYGINYFALDFFISFKTSYLVGEWNFTLFWLVCQSLNMKPCIKKKRIV